MPSDQSPAVTNAVVAWQSQSRITKHELTRIFCCRDVYEPSHICNHSDEEGRYSYVGPVFLPDPVHVLNLHPPQRNQPTMGVFAVQKLGTALAELIGCEEDLENSDSSPASGYLEVEADWGEGGKMAGWMDGWRKVGMERVEEVKAEFQVVFRAEYTRLMRLVSSFERSAGLQR